MASNPETETKTCGTCAQNKPLDAFSLDKTKSFGRAGVCKSCYREYLRKNHAKIKARRQASHLLNAEQEREKWQEWYYENREEKIAKVVDWKKRNPEKARAQYNRWYEKNKETLLERRRAEHDPLRARAYHLKHKYGLSLEDVDAMKKEQNDLCGICKTELTSTFNTHIDHDHETGKVRGLLCNKCNVTLGHLSWFEKHKTEIETYLRK
jgi:hypothetical protein